MDMGCNSNFPDINSLHINPPDHDKLNPPHSYEISKEESDTVTDTTSHHDHQTFSIWRFMEEPNPKIISKGGEYYCDTQQQQPNPLRHLHHQVLGEKSYSELLEDDGDDVCLGKHLKVTTLLELSCSNNYEVIGRGETDRRESDVSGDQVMINGTPIRRRRRSELAAENEMELCLNQQQQQPNGRNHHQGGPMTMTMTMTMTTTKVCARGHWRPAEDSKLRELVSTYGPQNWNLIAEKLDGRSGKSCRLRWFNQLDPKINKRAFTEEEEEKLLQAHKAYGNKWAMIARLFPGRTDNAVKNHWHVIMSRRFRERVHTKSAGYRRFRKNNHHNDDNSSGVNIKPWLLSSAATTTTAGRLNDHHPSQCHTHCKRLLGEKPPEIYHDEGVYGQSCDGCSSSNSNTMMTMMMGIFRDNSNTLTTTKNFLDIPIQNNVDDTLFTNNYSTATLACSNSTVTTTTTGDNHFIPQYPPMRMIIPPSSVQRSPPSSYGPTHYYQDNTIPFTGYYSSSNSQYSSASTSTSSLETLTNGRLMMKMEAAAAATTNTNGNSSSSSSPPSSSTTTFIDFLGVGAV